MAEYKDNEERIKVPRFEESQGFYTTAAKSKQMSKIKGHGTKPEIMLRQLLWNAGIRYRVNNKQLPGRPDIVSKKHKLAIFVDGEFWHGYNWEEKKHKIKTNRNFWIPKIERNMQRDREVNAQLAKLGFKVFRFWESEIKKAPGQCLKQVLDYLAAFEPYLR